MKFPSPFVAGSDHIRVVIETPKASPCKYAFDPETELFELKKVLADGIAFPMNFGFIPGTQADDGDPVDVLVLTERRLEMGCLLECRVIGVIQAEQQDEGQEPQRNDRIMAIPLSTHEFETLQTISDVGQQRLDDITSFFQYYRSLSGSVFKPLGNEGPQQALDFIRQNIK